MARLTGCSLYLIYRADPRERYDRCIARQADRASAWEIACRLNAQSVARFGPRGPLYYIVRAQDDRNGRKLLLREAKHVS